MAVDDCIIIKAVDQQTTITVFVVITAVVTVAVAFAVLSVTVVTDDKVVNVI